MTKGAANEPWVVKQILHDMDTIDLSQERIIIKHDQAPAKTELKVELARQRGAATASEESRVGDSNSNATIEVAVAEVENLVRTLRSSLESTAKSTQTTGPPDCQKVDAPRCVKHNYIQNSS